MEYPVLNSKEIGARIRELRIANHFRVDDVAFFMGFENPTAIYKWQRGESIPSVDNIYALSRLFGTTVDYILSGDREMAEPSLC